MPQQTTRIIGIDPGFGRIGIGIIEGVRDHWRALHFSCIETNAKQPFLERLEDINQQLRELLVTYRPAHAAVEQLYFNTNVTTAMKVAEARGVILLSLRQAGLPVYEFTPLEVKQTIVGNGRADKTQMQYMIRLLLQLNRQTIQDDAADALGVALTCSRHLSW